MWAILRRQTAARRRPHWQIRSDRKGKTQNGKENCHTERSPRRKGNTSALEEGDGNLLRGHDRACALLMAAEGNGFDDVLLYYNHLMEHLRWKNLGSVLAGGNGDVGDIEGKPEIQKAYELGKSIQ